MDAWQSTQLSKRESLLTPLPPGVAFVQVMYRLCIPVIHIGYWFQMFQDENTRQYLRQFKNKFVYEAHDLHRTGSAPFTISVAHANTTVKIICLAFDIHDVKRRESTLSGSWQYDTLSGAYSRFGMLVRKSNNTVDMY